MKQNEETFKLILNSSLDAIVCIDTTGKIIVWNPQAEKIFGWTEKEMLGKPLVATIVPQQHRRQHEKGFSRYVETGEARMLNKLIEITALNSAGKEFPVELTITPIEQSGSQFFCAFLRDISARKKVEEELRKSEQRYRSLIEQASDAILLADFDGNFIDVNESICALTGYSKDELLNMKVTQLIEPEHLKSRPIPYERFKTGEHIFSERRVLLKNGSVIDMEVNTKKIGDDMILAIGRDITERKKAEEQIVKSEQKYRSLIEQASDPIMVTDFSGNFVDVNTSLCDIFGYTKEELLKLNIASLIDPLQLKERPIQFERLAKGQQIFNERRMMRRDGSFIDVEANVKKVDENYVMAIARDITERKKAEAALSKTTYDIKERVKELKCLYRMSEIVNKPGSTMDTILQECVDIIPPAYQYPEITCARISLDGKIFQTGFFKETTWRQDADIVTGGKPVGKAEVFYTEEKPTEQEGPFLSEERALINSIGGIISNSIERKRAEEEIKQSQQQLRQLTDYLQTVREDERTNIAREIHDELGQHLTALKMDTFWLRKKMPAQYKAVIEKATGMISLIDDTISSVRRISSELRPTMLDDLGLLAALGWQGNEFEKRTGIHCSFHSTFNGFDFERNISTGIFRVFQESLTNVARHAEASEIKTTLAQNDGYVVLKIEDNGKGFDETAVKEKKTLGLVGMRERAIMFGGNLTIESAEGKGTVVILRVPVELISGKVFLKK